MLDDVTNRLQRHELTPGQALRYLRKNYLGIDQHRFANLVKLSPRKLSDLENDKGNVTVNTLNRVFKVFGLQVGLVASRSE